MDGLAYSSFGPTCSLTEISLKNNSMHMECENLYGVHFLTECQFYYLRMKHKAYTVIQSWASNFVSKTKIRL